MEAEAIQLLEGSVAMEAWAGPITNSILILAELQATVPLRPLYNAPWISAAPNLHVHVGEPLPAYLERRLHAPGHSVPGPRTPDCLAHSRGTFRQRRQQLLPTLLDPGTVLPIHRASLLATMDYPWPALTLILPANMIPPAHNYPAFWQVAPGSQARLPDIRDVQSAGTR